MKFKTSYIHVGSSWAWQMHHTLINTLPLNSEYFCEPYHPHSIKGAPFEWPFFKIAVICHLKRSCTSRSKVKWVKPSLNIMILAGGLTSTSSCHSKVKGAILWTRKWSLYNVIRYHFCPGPFLVQPVLVELIRLEFLYETYILISWFNSATHNNMLHKSVLKGHISISHEPPWIDQGQKCVRLVLRNVLSPSAMLTHTYTECPHLYIISLWRKSPCDVIKMADCCHFQSAACCRTVWPCDFVFLLYPIVYEWVNIAEGDYMKAYQTPNAMYPVFEALMPT